MSCKDDVFNLLKDSGWPQPLPDEIMFGIAYYCFLGYSPALIAKKLKLDFKVKTALNELKKALGIEITDEIIKIVRAGIRTNKKSADIENEIKASNKISKPKP